MIVFERRASTVLFNLLRSHPVDGPFLLPANICPIVPMVFHKAQRPFEFIDIAPDTICMDHDAVIERWSKSHSRPAGIIYVRTYGAIFNTSSLFASIKSLSADALIVDDRCLCAPEFGGMLEPHADVTLYSTGYAKYVDIGYGGFGVLGDSIPYARTESVFNDKALDNLTEQYKGTLMGVNDFSYKESDWLETAKPQEAWEAYRERAQLASIRATQQKAAINSIYSSQIPTEIQFPTAFQSWRFNIQVREKPAVLDAIRSEGLFASGHYDSLAGRFGPGNAPRAERLHRHVINLFNDRYFSVEQASRLADLLANFEGLTPGPLFS